MVILVIQCSFCFLFFLFLTFDSFAVVLNIHQPSSTLFGMFDNLILLAEGRLIYEGPVKNVGNYFAELGFVCPPGWAMADFLLELVSRCGDQSNSHWLERDDDSSGDVLKDVFGEGLKNHTPDSLAERFVAQRPPTPARKSSESPAPSKDFSNHSDIKTATSFPNNWFLQVFVLIQRFFYFSGFFFLLLLSTVECTGNSQDGAEIQWLWVKFLSCT